LNCPECGTEIESSDQNYCDGCGYKLTSEFKEGFKPIIENKKPQPLISSYQKKDGLFSNNQNHYSFKRNYWLNDKSSILDKRKNAIGILKRKRTYKMSGHELKEMDGTVSALFTGSELRDGAGNLIVEMKTQIAHLTNPDFTIEDKQNKKIYKAHVKSKDPYSHKRGFFIRITDLSIDKIVSEINVSNRMRNKTSIEVVYQNTDRRVIIFAAMSISRILLSR
jgi:hypothetical protein